MWCRKFTIAFPLFIIFACTFFYILWNLSLLNDSYHSVQASLRMLAQLVSHSGGTPQVLSSTPRGSEFQPEGKKIPSLAPVPMHWCGRPRSAWGPLHGPGRVPMGYGPQCQGGARVRGFSRSGKPRLLLESQYRWGGLSPPGRVFLICLLKWTKKVVGNETLPVGSLISY